MIKRTINSSLKRNTFKMCLLSLFVALTSCGTPHPVQLSQKTFSITGAYSAGIFEIKRIQLGFNGLKSKSIKKNETINPKALISYSGTGVFQAHWLIDGQLIKQEQVMLNRGSQLTLMPKLNNHTTSQYGRHVMQLMIKQPNVSFKTPELTYFVSQ